MRLLVDPRRVLVVALVVVVSVNLLSLVVRLVAPGGDLSVEVVRLVSVDAEANVPTWVNEALLLVSALVLWGLAITARRTGDRWWRHWALLAVTFGYLALDELVSIHEVGIGVVATRVEPSGVFTFGWVIVAAPLVLAFALVNVPFLRGLPPRTAWLVVIAGALYVTGAIGFEMISGAVSEGRVPEAPSTTDPVPYVLASQVEELLEMVGVSLFLYAVTRHARALDGALDGVRQVSDPGSPAARAPRSASSGAAAPARPSRPRARRAGRSS